MASFMKNYQAQAYAVLRIVTGFLFLWHGMVKLFAFPNPPPPGVPALVTYIGGPIELVGGALVMIGLFASWGAFFCSGMMAVAYWFAHATNALLPLNNGGELAVLYCFIFLYISAHGSGIWSVDGAKTGG
jgi:putative oxidoreductase